MLSRPEPGLALLSAGRRDVSFDAGLPVPLRVRAGEHGGEHGAGRETKAAGMTVTALNDQHAYLNVPGDSGLRPGDLVCLGISHPCTTFDKWRVIPVVDDTGHVTDAVQYVLLRNTVTARSSAAAASPRRPAPLRGRRPT